MKNASSSNNNGGSGLMRSGGMSKSTLSLLSTAAASATPTAKGVGHRRKTSAEIVSEAKSMLANSGAVPNAAAVGLGMGGSGARLVSTRRPITPREPRRQLYGKQAPPGRPPSSFSLRYLQFESRSLATLPILDPIQNSMATTSAETTPPPKSIQLKRHFLRTANSVDGGTNAVDGGAEMAGKLPAMLTPPQWTGSVDNLSAEMPPRMDFRASRINHVAVPPSQPKPTASSSAPATADAAQKPPKPIAAGGALDENRNPKQTTTGKPAAQQSLAATIIVGNHHQRKASTLSRNNDLLVQSSTETLLDMLRAHAGLRDCSDETATHIHGILTELYTRVKGARGEWRGAVLGALYGLVESTSPRILVSVARVVLVLCVTGSNLTGACKLVFKVARNETNDMLFVDSDVPELLIDGLGRASPLDEPEACIYGYGAVRFLANASIAAPKKEPSAKDAAAAKERPSGPRGGQRQKTIAYRLARHGAVQLMVLHLQMLNEAGASEKLTGPPLHAMFQLSGALRVLAKTPSLCKLQHITDSAINAGPPCLYSAMPPAATAPAASTRSRNNVAAPAPAPPPQILELYEAPQEIQLHLACVPLVRAAEICIGDTEVQTNVIRTISVLSELPKCAEALADCAARLGMLLGPCEAAAGGRTNVAKPLVLLVRLGYALGNVMAAEDAARVQFFNNDVAMEYLLQALEFFANQQPAAKVPVRQVDAPMGAKKGQASAGADTVVDVLVKLVRVVANMSVNAEVGYGLGVRPVLGGVLLRLLLTANGGKAMLSSDIEELLLATLGALHNLSFYQDLAGTDALLDDTPPADRQRAGAAPRPHPSSMAARLADLSATLCITLQSGPLCARIEAARVLGNMTRSPAARRALCAAGGLRCLVRNLEAGNDAAELVDTSCGVLVNLLADWERRAPFRELRGPNQLRVVLQRAAELEDWPLAATVCQALWNFLIDTANCVGALGATEADEIAGDLAEYLDEDGLFGEGAQPDERWEHFAVVAADLLERLQASIGYSMSPCPSTSDEEEELNDGLENRDGGGTEEGRGDGDERDGRTSRIGSAWQGEHFRSWLQED